MSMAGLPRSQGGGLRADQALCRPPSSALFLAISSARGDVPHHLQLAVAYRMDIVVEIDTGANVPGREPDLLAECRLAVRRLGQTQTAMLGTQRDHGGPGEV